MSANSIFKGANGEQQVRDGWGILSPDPAERSAIVTPMSDSRPVAATPDTDTEVRLCRYCTETLPPGANECPLCLREVQKPLGETRKTAHLSSESSRPSTATSLAGASLAETTFTSAAPVAAAVAGVSVMSSDTGAVYALESPALCPECQAEISTIQVIRVMRTQISFTSTLPRKAYVIACPACRRLLSAGLSGLF